MALSFVIQEKFLASPSQVISVLSDVASWGVADRPRLISIKNEKVTLAFDDITRAVISVESSDSHAKTNVLHELIKDKAQVTARKNYWKKVFIEMHRRLDQE